MTPPNQTTPTELTPEMEAIDLLNRFVEYSKPPTVTSGAGRMYHGVTRGINRNDIRDRIARAIRCERVLREIYEMYDVNMEDCEHVLSVFRTKARAALEGKS